MFSHFQLTVPGIMINLQRSTVPPVLDLALNSVHVQTGDKSLATTQDSVTTKGKTTRGEISWSNSSLMSYGRNA